MSFSFTSDEKQRFSHINGQYYTPIHDCMMDYFVQEGQLEVIIWLRELGMRWGKWTLCCGIVTGNLVLVKWLKENGCPGNTCALEYAMKYGGADIVEWLRNRIN